MEINRLRRKMGIYCSADHARTMRDSDADTRYWRSQVLTLRAQHQQAVSYQAQLWARYHYYNSRIPTIAITWRQKARKAKFEAKMDAVWRKTVDARYEEEWAYNNYLRAAKATKDTHNAFKAEQREYAMYAVASTARKITRAVTPGKDKPQNTRNHDPLATNEQAKNSRKVSLDNIICHAESRRSSHTATVRHQRAADMGTR